MKAEIMKMMDAKVKEIAEKGEAFHQVFKAQEEIIEETISKFRKETREARKFINNYQNAEDTI